MSERGKTRRRADPPRPRSGPPLRSLALHLLLQVLEGGGNSSRLLEKTAASSSEERALLTELVLGTLRRILALDALIAPCSRRPLAGIDPGVRTALRLGAYQLAFLDRIPAYAAVDETVEAVKRELGRPEAAFVNGVLRALVRGPRAPLPAPDRPDEYLTTTLSLPPFLAARWRERLGAEATVRLAEAAVRPARVTLRVLARRAGRDEVLAALAALGIEGCPGRYLDEALQVMGGAVAATAPFRDGLVIAQDEAAQIVARLLAVRPGDRVLDACAAPGGKTVALADLAGGRALLVALERRPGRLRLVRGNLKRTGTEGVHLVAGDAAKPGLSGPFERILLDAPCTGTGTIRRNPELRYRVDEAALLRSRERGRALLGGLLDLLAPGGRLVYSTCSLEPEENDEVVGYWLEREPRLRLADPRPELPAAAAPLVGDDRVLRTQPADVELDGFTAFVLERKP